MPQLLFIRVDILALPGASNSNLAGNVSVLLESAVTLSLQFKFPKPEEILNIIQDLKLYN